MQAAFLQKPPALRSLESEERGARGKRIEDSNKTFRKDIITWYLERKERPIEGAHGT